MVGKRTIHDGRFDKQPKSITHCVCPFPQIEGSIKVGVAGVATVQAFKESCFIWSCGDSLMASIAHLGGISRRDLYKNNSSPDGFVFYEVPQLAESPIGEQPIEFLSPPPCSDATQVFHYNYIPCIHSADDFFANQMIDVLHKPCLSASEFSQMPLGRFCAFGLQSTSQSLDFSNMMFDAFEEFSIGSGSEVVYAKVYPNNLRVQATVDGSDLFSNNHIQEQILPISGKECTSNIPISVGFPVIFRNEKNTFMPSFKSGKGAFAGEIKGIGTLVVLDGKLFRKINLSVLASLLGFKRGFNRLASQLGGEFKSASHVLVEPLMQGLPRVYLFFQRKIIGILSGSGEFLHSVYQSVRRRNFQTHSSLDNHIIPCVRKDIKDYRQFIPPLKSVGTPADLR